MTDPYLALALAGPHLVELTREPELLARWDRLPLAFTVLGIDRIDGSPPATTTLDGSAVGASLARRTRHGRFLVAASPQRDHPYNLARRVVSLGLLSQGRSGVLLGVRDAYAAAPPLTTDTVRDAAHALRALEQSWPHDALIGDRETGILVQSDRIVHVDLDGAFRIEGPLNAPEPATGASVIGWLGAAGDGVVEDRDGIDLVVGGSGRVSVVASGDPVPADVAGVVLRPPSDVPLAEVFSTAEELLAGPLAATTLGGPLRPALGLAPAPDRRATARAAFPVPQPHPSL